MSIYLSHRVCFAIMTSSCPGYELPYCTFVHDERKCSFRSWRNAELAAAPALCPVLHAQWSSSDHNHSSFLYFPFLCTVGSFHIFLSDSLLLSLSFLFPVYYIRCPVEPAAGKHVLTWTTLLNWLTMTERVRDRPQSVWLCASGRHVFLFVHLVNSCAHTRRCVCRGYTGMF